MFLVLSDGRYQVTTMFNNLFILLVFMFALCAGTSHAQTANVTPTNQTIHYTDKTGCSGANPNCANLRGDTWFFTAWSSSSTCSGPFNGGCVFGTFNDGTGPDNHSLS